PGDAFAAMRHLLTDNHEDPAAQRRHIRRAFAIYRTLLAGGVVERLAEPDAGGRRWRVTVDLEDDFALNQPLWPLALAASVLRYLADAYKALRQTVPEEARTEELTDLIEWLGELVRQTDSSLIDEWERLRDPDEETPSALDEAPPAVTGNVRAFRVLVRNA